jgi:hypothetical protein
LRSSTSRRIAAALALKSSERAFSWVERVDMKWVVACLVEACRQGGRARGLTR